MCGIVGYAGKKDAITKIINGLKSLEYRGYDSAGIAYVKENNFIIPNNIYTNYEIFFQDSEEIINDELKYKGINLKIKDRNFTLKL